MNSALTSTARHLADVTVGIARRHQTMERLALAAAVGTLAAMGVKLSTRATASACGGYDCTPTGCPGSCTSPSNYFHCTASWPCTGFDGCWNRACSHFCTSFC